MRVVPFFMFSRASGSDSVSERNSFARNDYVTFPPQTDDYLFSCTYFPSPKGNLTPFFFSRFFPRRVSRNGPFSFPPSRASRRVGDTFSPLFAATRLFPLQDVLPPPLHAPFLSSYSEDRAFFALTLPESGEWHWPFYTFGHFLSFQPPFLAFEGSLCRVPPPTGRHLRGRVFLPFFPVRPFLKNLFFFSWNSRGFENGLDSSTQRCSFCFLFFSIFLLRRPHRLLSIFPACIESFRSFGGF